MKDNQSTENVYPSLSTFDTSTFPTREILEKLLPETWESPIDKVVEGFGWTFSILESLLLSLPNSLHWSRGRCILRQQDSNFSSFFYPCWYFIRCFQIIFHTVKMERGFDGAGYASNFGKRISKFYFEKLRKKTNFIN